MLEISALWSHDTDPEAVYAWTPAHLSLFFRSGADEGRRAGAHREGTEWGQGVGPRRGGVRATGLQNNGETVEDRRRHGRETESPLAAMHIALKYEGYA
jgi:hypothetical protein